MSRLTTQTGLLTILFYYFLVIILWMVLLYLCVLCIWLSHVCCGKRTHITSFYGKRNHQTTDNGTALMPNQIKSNQFQCDNKQAYEKSFSTDFYALLLVSFHFYISFERHKSWRWPCQCSIRRIKHENENVLFYSLQFCAVLCILLKNRINYDLRMSVLSVLLALHLIFMIEKKTLEEKKSKKEQNKNRTYKNKSLCWATKIWNNDF